MKDEKLKFKTGSKAIYTTKHGLLHTFEVLRVGKDEYGQKEISFARTTTTNKRHIFRRICQINGMGDEFCYFQSINGKGTGAIFPTDETPDQNHKTIELSLPDNINDFPPALLKKAIEKIRHQNHEEDAMQQIINDKGIACWTCMTISDRFTRGFQHYIITTKKERVITITNPSAEFVKRIEFILGNGV